MDQLGADPMKVLERSLGLWALKFLVACLAITPLRRLTGISLLRYRRAIGLLAFIYACLHLTTYMLLDQGLDLTAIWADIVKRPYITIGMAAFLILIPLAATSNNAMLRRLGGPGSGSASTAGSISPPPWPRSTSSWWSRPGRRSH